MPEHEPMTPNEATDKLVAQFSNPKGDVAELIADGHPTLDIVAGVTAAVATTFTTSLRSTAAEAEYLSNWSHSLRDDCSIMYAQLVEKNPQLSRAELNQDQVLQILNGIRRGVHRAMVRSYAASKREKRLWNTLYS